MRVAAPLLLVPLLVACAPATPTPAPARVPVVLATPTTRVVTVTGAPTAAPAPPPAATATAAGVDYLALRTALLTPLGGLIVATRENSPARAGQRAAFDAAADRVGAAIQGDTSVNANRLHSAIVNAREAAARGDLAALERVRADLLMVR